MADIWTESAKASANSGSSSGLRTVTRGIPSSRDSLECLTRGHEAGIAGAFLYESTALGGMRTTANG